MKNAGTAYCHRKGQEYLGKRGTAEVFREGHNTNKFEKVMHEYKHGKLHSGSKRGPKVKSRQQALAIAASEAKKAGQY